jgi:hypothetical protein
MFERGGGFYSEHGFLTVDTGSVRRRTLEERLSPVPIVSLDAATLDEADRLDRLKRQQRPTDTNDNQER